MREARSHSSNGDAVELEADLVIVSAGAFGSPGVLLRSGIGPGDQLAEHGITVALDLPGVGANLQDHCGTNVVFGAGPELERELDRHDADERMVGSGADRQGCEQASRRARGISTW